VRKGFKCFRRRLLTCPPPSVAPPPGNVKCHCRISVTPPPKGWGPKRAWFLVSRSLDCFPSWGWNNNTSPFGERHMRTATNPGQLPVPCSLLSYPQKRVGPVLFYERETISVIVMTEIWWPRPLFGQSDVCVSQPPICWPRFQDSLRPVILAKQPELIKRPGIGLTRGWRDTWVGRFRFQEHFHTCST